MADEIAVDETGWPVVTNRQVQYPARVRIVPTAEDDVVDLEAVPGDVEAEGTDVGEGLFGAVRNYVDSRDGTKADGAYVEQEVGRVDGVLAALGGRVDGVADDVAALDGSKVSKAGDTMTGPLTLEKPLAVGSGGTGLTESPSLLVSLSSNSAAPVMAASPRPGVAGILPTQRGGTGQSSDPSMLVDLGSTAAARVFQASPSPGVKGTLPVANGGTGATTAAAAKTNLGIADVAKATKSFTVNSGLTFGDVQYYMKNGIVFVRMHMTRGVGGSVSNGVHATGVVLPSNMRPGSYIRSNQAGCAVHVNPMPDCHMNILADGNVQFHYAATVAPASGSGWLFECEASYAPGM